MKSKSYIDKLMDYAATLVDSADPLPIDDEVQKIRNPKRPPPGWMVPELRTDPVRFARMSLKEAVAAGRLDELGYDPNRARTNRDKYKALAKAAQATETSLEHLSVMLVSMGNRLREDFVHELGFREATDLISEVEAALQTVARIANKSDETAQRLGKRTAYAKGSFRRGFTTHMAHVYYLLTGLEPTGTGKESGTPFTRFTDAAMQSILPDDEPSCVSVVRTALPEFRRHLRLGYLNWQIQELWVTPPEPRREDQL